MSIALQPDAIRFHIRKGISLITISPQPEEIDHVLMEMSWHDIEADMPIPDGAQLSGTIRDIERDEFAMVAGLPFGV